MPSTPTVEAILSGDRRALAKAITLVESQRETDRDAAQTLLKSLLPHTGSSIRIGVTGVPGVGKSTFIETFGQHLIEKGHRLAVLAVDPSSPVAGGSILGDKTRMERLSRSEAAFIRPSPAGKALGGVAFKTRESLLLCEAAGYDVILVETVGVGQSEHQVAGMVDFFLLLMLPGGGDELQGIKKGILELADAIVVNKADGASETLARTTQQHYRGAMSLLKHEGFWEPKVMTCSALHQQGIEAVWETIVEYAEAARSGGIFDEARAAQNLTWMRQLIDELLRSGLAQHPRVRAAMPEVEAAVRSASQTPLSAAQTILALSRADD
ncbi:MAG: methylmalonyl Co-A mutase-associated GTPase MeaB [Halieaceae bacterium]|jgi:LAO/AO transport system kinase|nr:methylmalonyl Co-A mutase-associated GTPase MeaB [Halieaceae bacterium]RZO79027.1 MAG: methylmalonyl Co-A mutase-associated GTPase MeaB [Halieaceae bacterium]|tara:strand:+ start:11139 stop:12113 length:975 start_codon:yes stop_codon:yes gene_type:complete